jgi:hypothetical protein
MRLFDRVILGCTHRLWNRQISRILCRAYSDGVINSRQLHELAAKFDPTQRHALYGKYVDSGHLIGEAKHR